MSKESEAMHPVRAVSQISSEFQSLFERRALQHRPLVVLAGMIDAMKQELELGFTTDNPAAGALYDALKTAHESIMGAIAYTTAPPN
jgi:hypothetical protein